MPENLDGVLETALYVDDMARARRFYEEILGLSPIFEDARLTAYAVGGPQRAAPVPARLGARDGPYAGRHDPAA